MDNLKKRSELVLGMLRKLEKELFVTNKGKWAIIVGEAIMVIELLLGHITKLETELQNMDRPEG